MQTKFLCRCYGCGLLVVICQPGFLDTQRHHPYHYSCILRHAGLQRAISCAPVLTYPKVRSAPVLENHSFRHGLTNLQL
ncbi:hypothetical protein FGI60_11585 [Brucella haematophila]|nr:hypothetical protein FGI60_11585 [Brucella haematophila]